MNDKYLLHQKFLNESHLAWAVRLSDRILSCNIIGQSPQQINIWFSKGNTVLQLLDYDYLLERILSGNIFILSLFPYCAVLSCFSRVWLFATPWTVACQAPLSMGSPGKNTGVCCHSLLQGIFPTQGSNLNLPHCGKILCCLSHQGSAASKLPPIKLYFMFYVSQIVSVKSRTSELPETTLKSTCKWLTVWQTHSVPLSMALVWIITQII